MDRFLHTMYYPAERKGDSSVNSASSTSSSLLRFLTPREREVFFLIASGLGNREIARSLYISDKTVKNYVTTIRKKLGLANRTQIALFALRHGLLPWEQMQLPGKP